MSIMDVKEGDLIEVIRDDHMGSHLYRVTSAVPSEDGRSVMIQTEEWTGELAPDSPYRAEVVQDEPTRCWFG